MTRSPCTLLVKGESFWAVSTGTSTTFTWNRSGWRWARWNLRQIHSHLLLVVLPQQLRVLQRVRVVVGLQQQHVGHRGGEDQRAGLPPHVAGLDMRHTSPPVCGSCKAPLCLPVELYICSLVKSGMPKRNHIVYRYIYIYFTRFSWSFTCYIRKKF